MAAFGIIIPLRNDLQGANVQVDDLWPNSSQKNSVYDGEGQSGYLTQMMDRPGATVFTGQSYISGSRMTTAASVAGNWALGAAADWSGAAGHGGNDVRATQVPMFGLAAYLRERVANDPTGAGDVLAAADVDLMVTDIIAAASTQSALTLAAINAIIQARAGAGSGDGTEVLSGAASRSFGTVQDILRILSGEVYYVPTNTVVTNEALVFLPWSNPNAIGEVAGGTADSRRGIILTLAGAGLAASPAPVAHGRFLLPGEPGYVPKRMNALTSAFRASASSGKLRGLHDSTNIPLVNSVNFAYSATTVTASRPRAIRITGANIAANGSGTPFCAVYDHNGNPLNVP